MSIEDLEAEVGLIFSSCGKIFNFCVKRSKDYKFFACIAYTTH